MSAGPTDPSVAPAAPVGRTLALLTPVRGKLLLTTLLGSGAMAADIGLIATAAWLVSTAAEHPNQAELALAIVAVQFFGLSRGFLRYGERLVGHDAAFRLLADLRVRTYRELERLAPAGLLAFRRGDLLTRMVRDVDSVQDLVVGVVPRFGAAALAGSLTVVMVGSLLPSAGLLLAANLLVAAILVPWLTGWLAGRRESRTAVARAELATAALDLIDGAAELIAFGAVASQTRTVRERDAELAAISTRGAGTAGIGLALTTVLAGLACWECLLVGVPAVHAGRLAVPSLAVITLVPIAAFEIVVGLPIATQAFHRVRRSAARLFDITTAPTPVHQSGPQANVPDGPPDVEAESVRASYPGAAVPAIRDVGLRLPSGHRVALVGPSGAGKSTVAFVLVRFLDYRAGSVELNATEIDRIAADEVRRVIGLVDQDAYLFDATIAENLRLGNRHAADADLLESLDRVGLGSWVRELPDGLLTAVGGKGSRLSGGQRQRLAVARALLADFSVLVLDEPAEHLDESAADALMEDILRAGGSRSVLLITHRPTGLESFDEILVLEGGALVERGTHHELLATSSYYAELCRTEAGRTDHQPAVSMGPRRADSVPVNPISHRNGSDIR
jgi:thiol reductant ABC exporter CydC subunit